MATPSATAVPRSCDFPVSVGREYEARLLQVAVGGPGEVEDWRAAGPAFFMAGLAVMLASVRGQDRRSFLELAEQLHPGASRPETFARWLGSSPVRPSRFLPMFEAAFRHAA